MLTVKHVTETTTFIQQTTTVFRSNNGWVMWTDENGHENEIKYGIVWVMNDHGATVAKFDLGYAECAAPTPIREIDMAVAQAA